MNNSEGALSQFVYLAISAIDDETVEAAEALLELYAIYNTLYTICSDVTSNLSP